MKVLNELDTVSLYNDDRDLVILDGDKVSYYGKTLDANKPFSSVSGPTFFSIYTSITTKLAETDFKKFSIRMNSDELTTRDAVLMQEALSSVYGIYSGLFALNGEECRTMVSRVMDMNSEQLMETVDVLHNQLQEVRGNKGLK